ncbi:MAG: 4Fe-4S binding protein [Spirochaetales bacterium]|nr:4Fe-4S binding protein [Spirochaetales bacterium]
MINNANTKHDLPGPMRSKLDTQLNEYITGNNIPPVDQDSPVIYIGMGTCGIAAGAEETLRSVKNYLRTHHITATIIKTGCIGLCSSEPLLDIKLPRKTRISFEHVLPENTDTILASVFSGEKPAGNVLCQFHDEASEPWADIPFFTEHPFFQHQTRNVLRNCGVIDPEDVCEYISRGGYTAFLTIIHSKTPIEVCNIIEESRLQGRGGGGFLTGKKMKLALTTNLPNKIFICNADEGDPGAFMDRAVIEGDPHRLIEGLAIAAYTIGSHKAYIYIRAEYPLAIKRLDIAIDQAKKIGLIGENIFDSGFDLDIIVKKGAGAFVCGEETALIHSIEGKRGMPRPRPPYPTTRGAFGNPTCINNVETLVNIPEIINNGPGWFTSFGTRGSAGTKVFALSGKVKRTGLVEVTMGMSIRDIIFTIGGGIPENKAFKAVQIGGPSGGCIPEQHLDLPIDYDSLKQAGAMMGSGGLVVMDQDNCMVDVAKFFMDFIRRESCGKCIPCREGTNRIYDILNTITRNRRSEKETDALSRFKGILNMEPIAKVMKQTSLCGLGQTAANPVLSTLRWFRDEYEAHIFERTCPAKACKELLSFTIQTDLCKGCTLCAAKCPENAIVGQKKEAHYIMQDKCIGCGTCVDVCRFNAVKVV